MTYMLDTTVCVEYLRHGVQSSAAAKLMSIPAGEVVLCSIVRAELVYGALRSRNPVSRLQEVKAFVGGFESLSFDDAASDSYGEIRSYLAACGTPIGSNDLLIASIALANGLTLVTQNVAEFSRVPGLRWENWSSP